MLEINKVYFEECIEGMKRIDDKSIDMILCDLPYGRTQNRWDSIIPLNLLWMQYKRVIKDNGTICLTGSQPFTSMLVMSNLDMFKHEWIWAKDRGSNFQNVKREPMKEHESILIFGYKSMVYNMQKEDRKGSGLERSKQKFNWKPTSKNYGKTNPTSADSISEKRVPSSIQSFKCERGLHPTQKPIPLFEYLVRTYSNENNLILDNCMGSGTTAIACLNTNRNFIGFENNEKYYEICINRIENHQKTLKNQ
jgi:site-specific DNA-methyltransferase (adenine-specific)